MKQGVLCSDIYKVLAAPSFKYTISMFDNDCAGTITPSEARWFYVKPVNFMIQVPNGNDITSRPEVYLWKSSDIKDEKVLDILNRLKNIANQYGYGFTVYDFGSGNLPKKFSHLAMRNKEEEKISESLTEGLHGSARRSYYELPRSRMVIVHSTRVQEEVSGSRTRNIKEIFVECNGERRRMGTNNIHSAKAMVRHLNEGGSWGDKFSNTINMYSTDLESLKQLLPDLEISGRAIQAKKTLGFINNIKEYLKRAGTPRGYRDCLEQLTSMPRVGNKYIEEFAKRIEPMNSSTTLSNSYARQFLISECLKLPTYLDAIKNNISTDDINIRDLSRSAKCVCLGCVPTSSDDEIKPDGSIDDVRQRVLMYGNSIVNAVDDPIIKEALTNIVSKPYLDENDALFIVALGNSFLGKNTKKKEILLEPELVELTEWINGTSNK